MIWLFIQIPLISQKQRGKPLKYNTLVKRTSTRYFPNSSLTQKHKSTTMCQETWEPTQSLSFYIQHLHWTFLCPPQLKRRNSRPSGLHKTNLIPTLQLKHQVFEYNPPNFLFNAQEFIIRINCCKYVSKMDFYKS